MIGKALTHYFVASIEELKRVTWPTRKQIWNGTLLVVGMSVFLGLYLGLLDYGLNRAVEQLIR